MHSIFMTCQPRTEVLSGELREEIFAARLRDVIEGRADQIYQNPRLFFEQTYATDGLKTLLSESLGRLVGHTGGYNSVIRLETAFGGGKTHSLIALYHAAKGDLAPELEIVDVDLTPQPNQVAIAGIVGTDLDPSNGIAHEDTVTYTLWGEIAYQLGGFSAYQWVERSDKDYVAPGTEALANIIGNRPTLIMIDEIARHLRQASAVKAGRESDLANQTVAFLMSLFEYASSQPHVLVVFTLAESSDAFADETEELKQRLDRIQSDIRRISARQERVIRPSAETEMAAILNARLFQNIERIAGQETAQDYLEHYQTSLERGADIPQRATRAEYQAEIEAAYPFHPELLNVLNRKLSTIPNFQRTRGALRLLALSIRELWEQQPDETYLIHPHHLPLGHEAVANDLTSRLDRPRYRQVIEADIVSGMRGSPAHAQRIDQEVGGHPFAQRIATTIFLHSLAQSGTIGIDMLDLSLAVTVPGEETGLIRRTTDRLLERGWFIEYDQQRYRFKPEASLNKIISDESSSVSNLSVKTELENRIQGIWKGGGFKVVYFPIEPDGVPDNHRTAVLSVLHFDAAVASASQPTPPDLAIRIMNYSGGQQGFRTYKNNLVFLIADSDAVDVMKNRVRHFLAMQRILNDNQRLSELPEEQRGRLRTMSSSAQLDVRVAITRAYKLLYFADQEAEAVNANLRVHILPAQDQGNVENDQTAVILRALKENDKTLTQDTPAQAAQAIKSRVWQSQASEIATEDLLRAYARRLNMRIVFDVTKIRDIIINGIQNGVWVYFDERTSIGYDQRSPLPNIEINDDTKLILPEHYALSDRPIKGVIAQSKPQESTRPQQPTSTGLRPRESVTPARPQNIEATGAARQAIQEIRDHCKDGKISFITSMKVTFNGDKHSGILELRGLALALPQVSEHLPTINITLVAEVGSETLNTEFNGSWDRYRRLLKPTVDVLVNEKLTDFTADTKLVYAFTPPLQVADEWLNRWGGTFDQHGVGGITVEVQPYYEAGP